MNNRDEFRYCRDLLGKMVAFDTVNGAISGKTFPERPLAEFLEAEAKALGLETRRVTATEASYNLVVCARVCDARPWVAFDSHLDTVTIAGMSVPAHEPTLENNRMYGRGSCDTKASGAAMLTALAMAKRTGRLANNTAVIFTTDEEITKQGAIGFGRNVQSELGWTPALVVVGEPTLMRPVAAHNGVGRLRIETLGLAAHSSRPDRGRSAISDMVKVIQAIETSYIPSLNAEHPLTGKAQGSINIIRGGMQVNVVPASCVIEMDRRVVPGEKAKHIPEELEKILETVRQADPKIQVRLQDAFLDNPMRPLRTEDILNWLTPSLRLFAIDPTPMGVPYSTNASNYTDIDIPAIVIGPGDIAQAHTADEWIDLAQVDLAVEIYADLMSRAWE